MAGRLYNGGFDTISTRMRSFQYRRNDNIDHYQLAVAGYYQCPLESRPTGVACFCCGEVLFLEDRSYTHKELHGYHQEGCVWAKIYRDGVDLGFFVTSSDLLSLRYSGSGFFPSAPPNHDELSETLQNLGEPSCNHSDTRSIKGNVIKNPTPRPRESRLPCPTLPTIFEDVAMNDN